MKLCIFAGVITSLVVGSQASASILSASSQAVREPSAKSAGYWNAKTLQEDLNASLGEAAEAAASAGPLASSRAPVGGGLMVNGGTTGVDYSPFSGSAALDGLFEMGDENTVIARGSWDPNGPVITSNGGRGRDRDRDRGRGRDRDRDRDRDKDRDRDRDNPYATPEPSTWVLLGTGLLMLGAYVGLRRRDATSF